MSFKPEIPDEDKDWNSALKKTHPTWGGRAPSLLGQTANYPLDGRLKEDLYLSKADLICTQASM